MQKPRDKAMFMLDGFKVICPYVEGEKLHVVELAKPRKLIDHLLSELSYEELARLAFVIFLMKEGAITEYELVELPKRWKCFIEYCKGVDGYKEDDDG